MEKSNHSAIVVKPAQPFWIGFAELIRPCTPDTRPPDSRLEPTIYLVPENVKARRKPSSVCERSAQGSFEEQFDGWYCSIGVAG